ncbi:MAG TPA: NAD(P)-dependent alcohol dehydrogenase [Chitinophagaceae bacterium]|nr:NAD(P)-dependent alcohol dehydrogenase [Chitinophagaceae bacterium]
MITTKAWAAKNAKAALAPFKFKRREPRPGDVLVEIMYCGVCHSDIHQVRDEWDDSIYPMVPGHEIVGRVIKVGDAVKKFKPGDIAGVGVMVDSCRKCKNCVQEMEQYCVEDMTGTYNAYERDGVTISQGGYSSNIVTDERYVYHISDKLDLKGVAPLLCAGITTYSPLRYANVGRGTRVGVVGLGGLGHLGVKFAVAFGAEVTLISTTPSKEKDARGLGAHKFLLSTDKKQMKAADSSFDIILNTISAKHNYKQYLKLLDLNGRMLVVGLPGEDPKTSPFALIKNRRSITGSMIGGTRETQEMLNYCAEKNIVADVELIPIQQINEAYERMIRNDVRYRFVIDMSTLK